jgi:hypothetical protein
MWGKKFGVTSLRTAIDPQLGQREKEWIQSLDLRGSLKIGDSEAILRTAIVALAEARPEKVYIPAAQAETEHRSDGSERASPSCFVCRERRLAAGQPSSPRLFSPQFFLWGAEVTHVRGNA